MSFMFLLYWQIWDYFRNQHRYIGTLIYIYVDEKKKKEVWSIVQQNDFSQWEAKPVVYDTSLRYCINKVYYVNICQQEL